MIAGGKFIVNTVSKPDRTRKPETKTALQRLREFHARRKFNFLNPAARNSK